MRRSVMAAALACAFAAPAWAGSHLWVINEVFSNDDGTIQFIEMHVPGNNPGETSINGRWVLSTATTNQFTFPGNLVGNTAFAHLLLATQGFADLPGAPTPDYIIPDNFFDHTTDEDLEYWMYVTGDMAWSGPVPTDGVTSLNRDLTTGVNSPTNFAGESGSVEAFDCDDLGNCSGNGACVGQDLCQCDEGFEGPDCSQMGQVPTMSQWGLLALTALLLAGGASVIGRRQRVTA